MNDFSQGLSSADATLKRCFDLVVALIGLIGLWWLILLAFLAAMVDNRSNGFFIQDRVGRGGRLFKVIKIRTMQPVQGFHTTVTTAEDVRITWLGLILRRLKIDELPQLINVVLGDMSFVGPRPDVPGFADLLKGRDRAVLTVRPGITGPATLKYRDEEILLAKVDDPEKYNHEVIWPDKVMINREYVLNWRFRSDLIYIWQTITG